MNAALGDGSVLATLRRMLRLLFVVGTLGLGTELLLLVHTKEVLQLVPLVLLGVGLVLLIWDSKAGSSASVQAFRVTSATFVLAGIAGLVLHFKGNVETVREFSPDLHGATFFWRVIHGKNPPSLAPGAMVQLGLLGWISAYRHASERKR
ncbi:MAG: hypothetical protein U0527_14340 [Candidatus Eisenbacteria bacterium]